jgi:Kelch motif protein/galactose oxidase-like protein
VWEFSPAATGTWRQLSPLGDPMPPRLQAAAVYDPVRDRVIVIGGDSGVGALLNDAWALNLSGDSTWGELHPTGTPPSPRRAHTVIYDPVGDRVIVYGGYDENSQRRGDLWALTLSGVPSWQMLVSSTAPPSGRSGHVAVYDPDGRRMIMYGGLTGPGQYSSEVWALSLDVTTPVAVSLASVDVASDLVRLTWSTEGAANLRATVQRSDAGSDDWIEVGSPTVSGSDKLVFEDRTVVAGARYGYRLLIPDGAMDPTWVTVPVLAILSLAGASPNPSEDGVAVRFSLPGKDAATLELFDLGGRRIASREVGSLGPGEHLVPLTERLHLSAGVYLIRLTQGGRALTAKACVVR